MEKVLKSYLEKVSKYLKRIPASERADRIKEIESDMSELQNSGKTSDEIIERLGTPQNLAKAYLGDLLGTGMGAWKLLLAYCRKTSSIKHKIV